MGEFAGFGEAGTPRNALTEKVIEQDGGAVGGDLYDVFGGVGVGGLEPGDYGFVQSLAGVFACFIKDFGETGLGRSERMAEF